MGVTVSAPSTCVHCRADDLPYLVGRALGDSASEVLDIAEAIQRLPKYAQQRMAAALVGGDILLQTKLHVSAYADEEGRRALDEMVERERDLAVAALSSGKSFDIEVFARNVHQGAVSAMTRSGSIPAIGVVGSPSLVFNPGMNGELVHCIQREGCEAVLPYLSPSISYSLFQRGVSCPLAKALDELCASLPDVPTRYSCETVGQLKDHARGFIPEDVVCGAGWMLAGQMLSLWGNGVRSILYERVRMHGGPCLRAGRAQRHTERMPLHQPRLRRIRSGNERGEPGEPHQAARLHREAPASCRRQARAAEDGIAAVEEPTDGFAAEKETNRVIRKRDDENH